MRTVSLWTLCIASQSRARTVHFIAIAITVIAYYPSLLDLTSYRVIHLLSLHAYSHVLCIHDVGQGPCNSSLQRLKLRTLALPLEHRPCMVGCAYRHQSFQLGRA
ncbi:hypothetical protein C8Q74DRAFT_967179 [Fomes fomentarius]|nr:hypothetical protein C8Q74DRAFT_967179 [Fomes fomentarius]